MSKDAGRALRGQESVERGMKNSARAVLWWTGEVLCGVLFQLVPLSVAAFSPDGAEGGLMIYALCLYILQPVAALLAPFFLVWRKGVNPYAAFFPLGLALLLSPAYADGAKFGVVCLLLGLISAATGAELRKRTKKAK